MRASLFALLLLALVGAACSSNGEGAPSSPDGEWVLDRFTDSTGSAVGQPDFAIDFRVTGTEFGGSAGCNSMGGTIEWGDGDLEVLEAFWTEMACEPRSIMDFEQAYTAALLAVDRWTLADDGLTLSGDGIELRYTPRVAPPDLALVGTDWQLDTLFDGETASHSTDMADVVIEFGDDSVRARGRCWSIAGPAVIEPGGEGNLRVDFTTSDPDFTCDDRVMFDEVVPRLSSVDAYRISESQLTLETDGEPTMALRG